MEDDQARLLRTFFAESAEQLLELEAAALALSEGGDDSLLHDVYRHLHTLKGNASCLGFEALTLASHHLEDALARAIRVHLSADGELVGLLLEGVDALSRLTRDAALGIDQPDDPDVAAVARARRAGSPGCRRWPRSTRGPPGCRRR